MKTIRKICARARRLWPRRTLKPEIDEELRFHLEQRLADNVAAGMSPDEAAREARKRFGNVQSIREECRDARGVSWVETTIQDVRLGARMLSKNPGYTILVVLILGLGIGANTATFSIINSVLIRPLPYPDADRLTVVSESNLKLGFAHITIRPGNLRDWRAQNSVFEKLGGEVYDSVNLTGLDKPVHLNAAGVTADFFAALGVPAFLGRTLTPDDQPPGNYRVAVLSCGLWQRSFGGDRGVIGRTITLNGLDYTVVGVMPKQFKIYNPPSIFGLPTGDVQPQLWVPYMGSMDDRSACFFLAFGRLKDGVTPARAQSEMAVVAERVNKEFSRFQGAQDWGVAVQPLKEQIVGGSRAALILLLGAVGFVLLIACANVANLALARAAARDKEFAVRSALGASRARLVRQLLIESVILAVLGGTFAVLLAKATLTGLVALVPANFPRFDEIRLDGSVLGFTLTVSLLTGLLFGIAPALHLSAPDLDRALKESGRGSSDGHRRRRARTALVVVEVALAMMLLAGAGLMINSFARLIQVPPGFAADQLMSFDFSPPYQSYTEPMKRIQLVKQLRERLRAQPGVKSVATVYGLPFGTMLNSLCGSAIEGHPTREPGNRITAGWRTVSTDYFETMNIPVVAGRSFSEQLDTHESLPVAIVNESFARKYLPGENPIGKRIQVFTVSSNWNEIVGVIEDVKLTGLNAPVTPEVYQPDSQQAPWMFSLVVRSALPSRQIESLVQSVVSGLDKDLVPFNSKTMDRAISGSVASQRFTMALVGLFAALALTLTAFGIYGVVSYSVSQQTREIGIRMALGAPRGTVLRSVLRQGLELALTGLAVGLLGSLALTRFIAAQLFGVSAEDPVTFTLVAVALMLVMVTACYLPARRATRINPMTALRYE